MNFDQARELSFLVPWKTMECFSGPECWCRIILPVEPIIYSHEESPDVKHEYVIVDAGSLDQTTAEYMVKLHNEYHERMKETMDSIVDSQLTKEQKQKENFLKLWDQLNVGPRTIEIKEID